MSVTFQHAGAERPVSLPAGCGKRFLVTMNRAVRRKCPYCGGGNLFKGWFTLKDRCPHCKTLFEHEEGFFLGSYVINIGFTELLTVLIVVWLIAGTDLSVLQMQIYGVGLAVLMPIAFYPIALLQWVALDISFHPPGDFSRRVRK